MSRDEVESITVRRGVEFCEWFLLGRIVRYSIGEPDGGQSVTVKWIDLELLRSLSEAVRRIRQRSGWPRRFELDSFNRCSTSMAGEQTLQATEVGTKNNVI